MTCGRLEMMSGIRVDPPKNRWIMFSIENDIKVSFEVSIVQLLQLFVVDDVNFFYLFVAKTIVALL